MHQRNRFLDRVEQPGNALPDPVVIFVGLIAFLMAMSAVGGQPAGRRPIPSPAKR